MAVRVTLAVKPHLPVLFQVCRLREHLCPLSGWRGHGGMSIPALGGRWCVPGGVPCSHFWARQWVWPRSVAALPGLGEPGLVGGQCSAPCRVSLLPLPGSPACVISLHSHPSQPPRALSITPPTGFADMGWQSRLHPTWWCFVHREFENTFLIEVNLTHGMPDSSIFY